MSDNLQQFLRKNSAEARATRKSLHLKAMAQASEGDAMREEWEKVVSANPLCGKPATERERKARLRFAKSFFFGKK